MKNDKEKGPDNQPLVRIILSYSASATDICAANVPL